MKGSEQEKFLKEQCDLFAFVPFNLAERFKGPSPQEQTTHVAETDCEREREREGAFKDEYLSKQYFPEHSN